MLPCIELQSVNLFALCTEACLSSVGLFICVTQDWVLCLTAVFLLQRYPKPFFYYGAIENRYAFLLRKVEYCGLGLGDLQYVCSVLSRAGITNHVIGHSAIQNRSHPHLAVPLSVPILIHFSRPRSFPLVHRHLCVLVSALDQDQVTCLLAVTV